MPIEIPTTTELENTIENAVRRALTKVIPELLSNTTSKKYLTKKEAIQLLNVSSPTLQRMRDERRISFIQDGRKILYPYAGIVAYLESHHIKVVGE